MPLTDQNVADIRSKLAYQDPGNSGTFTFEEFSLNKLNASVEQVIDAATINLTIVLHQWGCIQDPHLAYYGQVSLDDVAKWREHGPALFAKNLRGFMKSTQVSESITVLSATS